MERTGVASRNVGILDNAMSDLPSLESLKIESLSGEVIAVTAYDVSVLFETGEGRLEQIFQSSQFLPGYVPEIGDQVVVVRLLAPRRRAKPPALDEASSVLEQLPNESEEPWSAEKDARRCELIDKKIQGTLQAEESREFAELQRQAVEYFDRVAPPPIEGARRLHERLLKKMQEQQRK